MKTKEWRSLLNVQIRRLQEIANELEGEIINSLALVSSESHRRSPVKRGRKEQPGFVLTSAHRAKIWSVYYENPYWTNRQIADACQIKRVAYVSETLAGKRT